MLDPCGLGLTGGGHCFSGIFHPDSAPMSRAILGWPFLPGAATTTLSPTLPVLPEAGRGFGVCCLLPRQGFPPTEEGCSDSLGSKRHPLQGYVLLFRLSAVFPAVSPTGSKLPLLAARWRQVFIHLTPPGGATRCSRDATSRQVLKPGDRRLGGSNPAGRRRYMFWSVTLTKTPWRPGA